MASGREMRAISSIRELRYGRQQQLQQQQQQQHVSGIRLAPIESSDSSGAGAKKKRLTKKRHRQKSTFIPSKVDRYSSDDENDDFDVDKNLSNFEKEDFYADSNKLSTKVEDDGFGSYESNSSGRSFISQVNIQQRIVTCNL